jgi:hypothetical protein
MCSYHNDLLISISLVLYHLILSLISLLYSMLNYPTILAICLSPSIYSIPHSHNVSYILLILNLSSESNALSIHLGALFLHSPSTNLSYSADLYSLSHNPSTL